MKSQISQSAVVREGESLFLDGPMIKDTVMGLLEVAKPLFINNQPLCVDLSRVTQCDSASLALLLELMRLASQKNISISFINPPKQMMDIANVNGLNALLPISEAKSCTSFIA